MPAVRRSRGPCRAIQRFCKPFRATGLPENPYFGFVDVQVGDNVTNRVEKVKRLLRLDLLRRLPHLVQLAAVTLELIQEPVQVVKNLVQSKRRKDAVDADLDTLHLG